MTVVRKVAAVIVFLGLATVVFATGTEERLVDSSGPEVRSDGVVLRGSLRKNALYICASGSSDVKCGETGRSLLALSPRVANDLASDLARAYFADPRAEEWLTLNVNNKKRHREWWAPWAFGLLFVGLLRALTL